MTTSYDLEIEWPIQSSSMRLGDLRQEAHDSLLATLTTHGLTATSLPTWHITHGTHPTITTRLAVTGPPGLPTHIEATHAQGAAA